ncbi:MAG TPA: ATP-binding protein [Chitinophagales bacterium]|nr:ATP-binding protein [Chitinophagales bacterium]
MTVKTKIRIGLIFLLAIIILLAGSGSFYVNRLADESKDILKANYNTLQYTKYMVEAIDNNNTAAAIKTFEENLVLQENNITEVGEADVTRQLRSTFEDYKSGKRDDSIKVELRRKIFLIQSLNMDAIVKKNAIITEKTKTAFAYITILGTTCFLLSFTFVINFPRWIADPIARLAEGIKGISDKNYSTRIEISSRDEFGALATAFNNMAAELNRWENSNVSKLLFEKSRIETIINNMQDAVIGLDEKKKVLFINKVAENLLMLAKNDVVGKYAPDVALRNDLLRNLLNKDETGDLKIYANNRESYFTKNYREVKSDDTVIGEVIVLHNVTPFKELDFAKTNFISTVSHELKTPISAIKMEIQLLKNEKNGVLNAEQKQLLESIEDDTERLLKIIGELLNMTQIETGNIQLSIGHIEPEKIIQLAIQAIAPLAEQKQIKLETSVEQGLPTVNADLDKTVWVMVNLLTNAIRYSYENGLIEISAGKKDEQVYFAVKDYGSGIDAKYVSRVFDRYFKVPGSKGGTGLGLAISKEFIEAQGGKIWVESIDKNGTTFGFVLNT